tara:strand:- start:6664 stop:7053 length:390 start_codon:yes stop_codon:yes gene_type:complete
MKFNEKMEKALFTPMFDLITKSNQYSKKKESSPGIILIVRNIKENTLRIEFLKNISYKTLYESDNNLEIISTKYSTNREMRIIFYTLKEIGFDLNKDGSFNYSNRLINLISILGIKSNKSIKKRIKYNS